MSANDGSSPEKLGEFARFWPMYQKAGLAPVPTKIGEKRPAINWRLLPRLTETALAKLARKFREHPIGILTGARSGIVIVDVDANGKPERVPELVKLVVERCGDTPLKVQTPSGGMHLYYRYTEGNGTEQKPRVGIPVMADRHSI